MTAVQTAWATAAREYETIYILDPKVPSSTEEQVAKKMQDIIANYKGKLLQHENWGRRLLAYPIKKNKRGVYVYLRYAGFNDVVAEIERNLGLQDAVMRQQTIKLDDHVVLDTLEVNPEEIAYAATESPYDESEDHVSLEESLGISQNRRRYEPRGDARSDDDDGDDDVDDDNRFNRNDD